MSGIAAVLARARRRRARLRPQGLALHAPPRSRPASPVTIGHDAANLGDAALVVTSSAIAEGNPELRAARAAGLPVLRRAEMLARVMALRRGIAVAGTHGKTTTSSMISHVLHQCGLDPTFLVGGELNDIGSNAGVGAGRVAGGRGRRERRQPAVPASRGRDRRATWSSTTTPTTAAWTTCTTCSAASSPCCPTDGLLVLVAGSGGEGLAEHTPAPVRASSASSAGDLRAEVERVDDRGSVFTVRDGGGEALARVDAARAGRAQRPQRPHGAGRAAPRRRDPGGRGAAPARRSAAPRAASSTWASTAACWSSTTTRTTPPRSPPRSPPP